MAAQVCRDVRSLSGDNFSIGCDKTFIHQNMDSVFTVDYKPPAAVPVMDLTQKPPCGEVIGGDDRIHEDKTETLHSFINHNARKYGREYDQNAMRKTNFKMNADVSKVPFAISNYKYYYPPKEGSKPESYRVFGDDVVLGEVGQLDIPIISTYKDKFGAHDVNKHKVIKSYSRHYDSCIIRDNDHNYSVTSKEAFPGLSAPRVRKLDAPTGTNVPRGDREKITTVMTTSKESYPPINDASCRVVYDPHVASDTTRKTNIKQYDAPQGDADYSSITQLDYHDTKGKPSATIIYDRNKSSIPAGDQDLERCLQLLSTTSNDVEFSGDVHKGHHNPIVKGADILTKSNVHFSPSNLQNLYYDATTRSVFFPQRSKRMYDRTAFHKPSAIPVKYYENEVNFATTTSSDYWERKQPKMVINPNAKKQMKYGHQLFEADNRDFRTTSHDDFTEKSNSEKFSLDTHRFQRSSVPLGTFH